MVFASVTWYGFLMFYVGYKSGGGIKAITEAFEQRGGNETER